MKTKEKFIKYEELLKKWSTKINLVAPSTLTDIQNRHINDSVQLAKYIPKDVLKSLPTEDDINIYIDLNGDQDE